MALVGLAHGISHFGHLLLPPLFPLFMQEFGLSFSQVGLLTTLFFLVSGVGQAVSGFVVDRWGARPVLFASLGGFVAAALATASAQAYPQLLVAAALAGLGNAAFHPVDFSILNQRVSAQRLGQAFSVHGLSGNLGWALAPVFLVGLSTLFHWRVAYLAAAALFLLVAWAMWLQRAWLGTEVLHRQGGPVPRQDVAFFRLPVVWWCFVFFLLSTMTLAVVQNYSVPILQALHGISMERATLLLTAYLLCGAAGIVLGGVLSSRHPHADRVVAWGMVSGALALLLVASSVLGGAGSMAALVVTGFAVGMAGPGRDLMIRRATPKGATGRVYGLVYSGLDVGLAVAPLLFGVLMDRGWFAATLVLAAATLAAAAWVAVGVGRRASENV